MEITHLGHACLLVDVADQRVLIDPGTFSDFEDVHDLTAIVVTHQHADHCDPVRFARLVQANRQATLLVEPDTAELLAEAGQVRQAERMTAGETVELGRLTVRPVGRDHAVIHPYVDRVGNVGVVLSVDREPTVFHPGDALDAEPGEVDLLCVPVNAPWGKISETIEFVRRVAPTRGVVPIHDGLLNDRGRPMYLKHIGSHGAKGGVEVLDLRGEGPTVL